MDTARWLASGEPLTRLQVGGRRTALAAGLVGLLAIWSEQRALVFLVLAGLAIVGVARWWSERALRDVAARHELLDERAFPDDRVRIRLVAENHKLLPLAWVRARSAIPPDLTPPDAPRRWPGLERGGYLQGLATLPWFGRAVWEFELPCRARGVHAIGPLELTAGDPFGLFAQRAIFEQRETVVVYPRVVALRRLGFPFAPGLGAAQRRRALQDDPSRFSGVRDYRPGDPLRRVHWKATARLAELQVRLIEPAAAPALLLVLAADTFDFPWTRYREDLFELAVSALASVAWRAHADGWPVGLLANTTDEVTLLPASSPAQLSLILEALARVKPASARPIDELLARHAAALRRATCALALGRSTTYLRHGVGALLAARQPLALLYGEEPHDLPGRTVGYRLRQWDDLARTLESPGEVLGAD